MRSIIFSFLYGFFCWATYMDTQRQKHYRKQARTLSPKAIQDFQKAYFLEFGIRITPQQAQTDGLRFLQFMKHILRPIPIRIERKNYGK